MTTYIDTVVIGAGQAGLAMAYHLKRSGREFVVLNADERVGDCWRERYDSLRLFSMPKYASLPGWPIPVSGYAVRDEMADYLEAYAARFDLPVRNGARVHRVSSENDMLRVSSAGGDYLARNVIVATGAHRLASVPGLAGDLDPGIRQLTSLEYRSPAQFSRGPVLVVGAGNSGTDIALDAAAAGHETYLAGRHPGQVPFDIDERSGRRVVPLVMFVFRHVLTLRTPMGRRVRAKSAGHGVNLVRNKLTDLDAAGVRRVGRIEEVRAGQPLPSEGEIRSVGTVVWCTGSGTDHRFLDVPVFSEDGSPLHRRGVSVVPGLYFLGLHFQFALASEQIQGVDRDARYLRRHLRTASPDARLTEASTRSTATSPQR